MKYSFPLHLHRVPKHHKNSRKIHTIPQSTLTSSIHSSEHLNVAISKIKTKPSTTVQKSHCRHRMNAFRHDELKLFCTNLELESLQMKANEEIIKNKEYVKNLLNLLKKA